MTAILRELTPRLPRSKPATEFLNAMASGIKHIHNAYPIYRHSTRHAFFNTILNTSAKLAITAATAALLGDELSIGAELLNAVEVLIGDIDVACAIYRHTMGDAKLAITAA